MKVKRLKSKCISCLVNKQLNNVPDGFSESQKINYMQEILKIISEADAYMSAPEVMVEINRCKEKFGITNDLSEMKRKFNKLMLSLEDEIQSKIESSSDSLKTAVLYAMAGNFIDFAVMDTVLETSLKEKLDNATKISIDATEFENFRKEISSCKNVAYLLDNCGEIVVDKLLIKEILRLNKSVSVTVLVRGEPVWNDCTLEDAEETGLDKIVLVISNGSAVGGTSLEKISEEARRVINDADVIISKGQGNFETLQYCGKNIYYLFLCKCHLFAERFGVPLFTGMFMNENKL